MDKETLKRLRKFVLEVRNNHLRTPAEGVLMGRPAMFDDTNAVNESIDLLKIIDDEIDKRDS